MVAEYLRYWRHVDLQSLGELGWLNPYDSELESLWVPHTTPGTAAYDPLLVDLLQTVGAKESHGHTRRISQIKEILSSLDLSADDVVLECFSGPGSLTIPLALNC